MASKESRKRKIKTGHRWFRDALSNTLYEHIRLCFQEAVKLVICLFINLSCAMLSRRLLTNLFYYSL